MAQNSLVIKEVDPNKLAFNVKEYESGKVISSTKNCSSETAWELIRKYIRKHQGLGIR